MRKKKKIVTIVTILTLPIFNCALTRHKIPPKSLDIGGVNKKKNSSLFFPY